MHCFSQHDVDNANYAERQFRLKYPGLSDSAHRAINDAAFKNPYGTTSCWIYAAEKHCPELTTYFDVRCKRCNRIGRLGSPDDHWSEICFNCDDDLTAIMNGDVRGGRL